MCLCSEDNYNSENVRSYTSIRKQYFLTWKTITFDKARHDLVYIKPRLKPDFKSVRCNFVVIKAYILQKLMALLCHVCFPVRIDE